MKVAVLSMALLFTILLCTPADAQVVLEESGDYSLNGELKIEEGKKPEVPFEVLLRQKRLAVGLRV